MTQLVIGTTVMAATLSVAVNMVLPSHAPFVVNSLTYDAGVIIQDRTIATEEQAFYAQWAVTVENAETGESVRWCEGSGANAYPPGRNAVTFTLADWTGKGDCTPESLPPGRYALRASWRWGETITSEKSNVFEVVR